MDSRMDLQLKFLKEIEKYKTIERSHVTSNLDRAESDAEHSWHLAMFILLFEKELPKDIDLLKTLKLALIHDLVEIYTGDTFMLDTKGRIGKEEREMQAARKLFAQLPSDLQKEYMDLFIEYEEAETREAKIVKAFDKIQPITQNLCTEGVAWKKHKLNYEMLDNYKRKHVEHDEKLFEIYTNLMQEGKVRGLI